MKILYSIYHIIIIIMAENLLKSFSDFIIFTGMFWYSNLYISVAV